jgi:alpha-D-ribose 1-methylphosphonate 5-triphosphate synthase subunit PhnH
MDRGLDGGFAEPVLQSQTAFRAVMDALANPGTVQKLVTPHSIQSSISAELASVLLTLSDHDTSIWLDDGLRADAGVLEFVNFHTGAPVVREPGRAAFAFATGAGHLPRFDQFNLGTQEYPDRSTTIVLAVPSLEGGAELITRGPGIKDHGHISPVGLPGHFVAQWAANRELFPRGIDLLLVADGAVMGLPRSTRITEGH